MSRVDDLISELAPEGVPHRSIGDVAQVGTGSSDRQDATQLGEFPFYVRSREVLRIGSFEFDEEAILIPGEGGIGEIFHYVTGRYALHQRAYRIRFHDRSVNTKFAYYYFSAHFKKFILAKAVSATVTSIRKPMITDFKIPVPPLEVQVEIVRILGQFEELHEQLEAELEARRRQYEYYRAALLRPNEDWHETTIGEVAEVFDGPHATPKKTTAGPWYLSISSLKGGNVDLTASAHLATEDLAKWTRRVAPRAGDTLFSYETRIGQAAYWERSDPAALGRRMGLLRPRDSAVVPKFLTIAYLSPGFQSQIESNTVHGSTVDRISIADLPNWPISMPSIEEQQRIIALLEDFDALVNDHSVGLPGELRARRKQYEHYRQKLLTFREAAG